jgi:hypothetical protein
MTSSATAGGIWRLEARWPAVSVIAIMTAASLLGCSDLAGDEPDDISAYVMCQEFVKDQLKAPATAGFPLIHEATVSESGSEQWNIRSHVDSENSFGANIRTQYGCEIKYVGNDEWQLVDLQFDE